MVIIVHTGQEHTIMTGNWSGGWSELNDMNQTSALGQLGHVMGMVWSAISIFSTGISRGLQVERAG